MVKKFVALALASGIAAAPAMAITFTPGLIVNLSGTDLATATQTVDFSAGTYVVSLINQSQGGAYTAVSVATPAASNFVDYYSYYINGGSQTYVPGTTATRYATADAAFAAYSAFAPLRLTFTTASSVKFQIGDTLNSLGDNTGGTSLSIAAVPEPASWALMLVGFGAVGCALRSRRSSTSVSFA